MRADHPGHGAGRSDGGDRQVGGQRDQRSGGGEAGQQEHREIAGRSEPALQPRAEDQEEEHAPAELEQAAVHERRAGHGEPGGRVGHDAGIGARMLVTRLVGATRLRLAERVGELLAGVGDLVGDQAVLHRVAAELDPARGAERQLAVLEREVDEQHGDGEDDRDGRKQAPATILAERRRIRRGAHPSLRSSRPRSAATGPGRRRLRERCPARTWGSGSPSPPCSRRTS